jgi:hypothetical protein
VQAVVNGNALAASAALGPVHAQARDRQIPNTGVSQPLVCRFPFSHAIVKTFEARETRDALNEAAMKGGPNITARLQTVSVALFGGGAVGAIAAFQQHGELETYLHDLVAMAAPQLPGLGQDDQLAVYKAVVRASRPDGSMATPAGIHAACWASEKRLFHTCSLLATNSVPPVWKDEIVASLLTLSKRDELHNFDGCMLVSILGRLWASFTTTCSKEAAMPRWLEWSQTLDTLRPDLNSLFFGLFDALVDSSSDSTTKLYGGKAALDLWVSWRGLHILQIAMQVRFLP